jgi:hypothetical protein
LSAHRRSGATRARRRKERPMLRTEVSPSTIAGVCRCRHPRQTHHAALVDSIGRHLADDDFPTTAAGYRALLAWIRGAGELVAAGVAATVVAVGRASGLPKSRDGIVESIRCLRIARRSAVKARTQALNQIHGLPITAPADKVNIADQTGAPFRCGSLPGLPIIDRGHHREAGPLPRGCDVAGRDGRPGRVGPGTVRGTAALDAPDGDPRPGEGAT